MKRLLLAILCVAGFGHNMAQTEAPLSSMDVACLTQPDLLVCAYVGWVKP